MTDASPARDANPGTERIEGIDAPKVTAWLAERTEITAPLSFRLIAGGRSNMTFTVTDAAGRRFVLRRPPMGKLLPSAHDVAREHRLMSALAGTAVPVPRLVGLCQDPSVNERDFYVMHFLVGVVVLSGAVGRTLTASVRPQRPDQREPEIHGRSQEHPAEEHRLLRAEAPRKDAGLAHHQGTTGHDEDQDEDQKGDPHSGGQTPLILERNPPRPAEQRDADSAQHRAGDRVEQDRPAAVILQIGVKRKHGHRQVGHAQFERARRDRRPFARPSDPDHRHSRSGQDRRDENVREPAARPRPPRDGPGHLKEEPDRQPERNDAHADQGRAHRRAQESFRLTPMPAREPTCAPRLSIR